MDQCKCRLPQCPPARGRSQLSGLASPPPLEHWHEGYSRTAPFRQWGRRASSSESGSACRDVSRKELQAFNAFNFLHEERFRQPKFRITSLQSVFVGIPDANDFIVSNENEPTGIVFCQQAILLAFVQLNCA